MRSIAGKYSGHRLVKTKGVVLRIGSVRLHKRRLGIMLFTFPQVVKSGPQHILSTRATTTTGLVDAISDLNIGQFPGDRCRFYLPDRK